VGNAKANNRRPARLFFRTGGRLQSGSKTAGWFAFDGIHIMADCGFMTSKHITLTDPVADIIKAEIASGRYKDVSSAINDAAWNYFIGAPSPFSEYGVTPEEVEASAAADLKAIKADRAGGKLIPL
jgi:hypothetical protein